MARAVLERGGRVMTLGSTGSTPNDCAGGPSMRMSVGGGVSTMRGVWEDGEGGTYLSKGSA
jgi:hypothetical protein